MNDNEKVFSKGMLGKTVVSKGGIKFGKVGDIIFETNSGELIHIVLENPTSYIAKMEMESDDEGQILIPFSSVIAMGDFLVVSEEELI